MKELTVLILVAAAVAAILWLRSRSAQQRRDTISRIQAERDGRSESPLADLFEAEGVPVPNSRAATLTPPPDPEDPSVVEPGQHP